MKNSLKSTTLGVMAALLISPSVLAAESGLWENKTPAEATLSELMTDEPQYAENESDAYLDNGFEGGIEEPLSEKEADSMSVEELKNELTDSEIALYNKVHGKTPEEMEMKARATYPALVPYVKGKNYPLPKIEQNPNMYTVPKVYYKSGKPTLVIDHETANPTSNINGEMSWMYQNKWNGFVHAFVDAYRIVETAPDNQAAWGAGPYANPYAYHIEQVRHRTFDEFARATNNQAYLTAVKLKKYGMKPSLADTNRGNGTVSSHDAISRYWGGTDHTDPIGYFKSWGTNMNEFYQLVQWHYDKLSGTTQTVTVKSETATSEKKKIIKDVDYANKAEGLGGRTVAGNTKNLSSKDVLVTKNATLSNGTTHKYITQNGKNLGWVRSDALGDYARVSSDVPKNQTLRVKSGANYTYSTRAEGLVDRVVKGNVKDLPHRQVEVTREAKLTDGSLHKYINQDGKAIGWVRAEALEPFANVASDVAKKESLQIKAGASYTYSSRADGLANRVVKGNVKDLPHRKVDVTREAKLTDGSLHKYINQDGKALGWVRAEALEPITVSVTSRDTKTEWLRVKDNVSYTYGNKADGLKDRVVKGNVKDLKNKDVTVTETAKLSNGTTHKYITQNGTNLGWVDARALDTFVTISSRNSQKEWLTIKNGVSYTYGNQPEGVKSRTILGNVSDLKNKDVTVLETVKLSNGTTHKKISQNGKDLGWVKSDVLYKK